MILSCIITLNHLVLNENKLYLNLHPIKHHSQNKITMNSTDEIIHFWAICIGGKFHNDKQLRTEVIHLNKNKV